MEPEKEEVVEIEKILEEPENYRVLKAKSKVTTSKFLYQMLEIMYSSFFWILFLSSIIASAGMASYGYIVLQENMSNFLYYSLLTMDIIYITFYLTAVFVYFNKKARIQLHKRSRDAALLVIDFFLAFPFSYIYEGITHKSYKSTVFLCFRNLAVLRLMHVVVFFYKKLTSAGSNHIKYFIFMCVMLTTVVQYIFACIWYLTNFANEQTFFLYQWDNSRLVNNSTAAKGLYSYYFAVSYFTSRIYGDIIPVNNGAKIISSLMIFIGFLITTGMFIAMLSFLLNNNSKRIATYRMQVNNINDYVQSLSMDGDEKKLVKNYYKNLWTKKHGVCTASGLELLPFPLKIDVCFDINISPLQSSLLFRNKSEAFLRTVSLLIRHEFYQPGELIYQQNAIKNKMIFIVLGTVQVLSDEDNENSIIEFGPGTCLGESALFLTIPAKSSVRTVSYAEFQVLYKKEFHLLLDLFPQIYLQLHDTIVQRITDAQDKYKNQIKTQSNLNLLSSESHSHSTIRILKDKLKGLTGKNEDDKYLDLYKLDDDNIEIRKQLYLSPTFPWILQPDSSPIHIWEIVIVFVASFVAVVYPYFICFKRKFPQWLLTCNVFVDLFLTLDVIVILFTGIKEKNETIRTFIGIVRKRLTRFGFYLDFLSCLKLEIFHFLFIFHYEDNLVLLYSNRILKSYRIFQFLIGIEKKIDIPILIIRFIKYLILSLLIIYWTGACLYLITCYYLICTEDGWYIKEQLKNLKNEIRYYHDDLYKVIVSLYYSTSSLSSVAFGDILSSNTQDMIALFCVVYIGVIAFSYCVAELLSTISHQLRVVNGFRETLFSTISFMNEKKLDKAIKKRVKNFIIVQWYYDKGVGFQRKSLFFNANKNIQEKVQIYEKMETIKNTPLFKGTNSEFLRLIVARTETLILPPNEFVAYEKNFVKILYIIQDGYCIRRTGNSEVIMGPNSFFGTMYIFAQSSSLFTVRTVTHVKILWITAEVFWETLSLFPDIEKEFQETRKNFDFLEETKTIQNNNNVHKVNSKIISEINGSFVNLISYCHRHNENYIKPFLKLNYMCWIGVFFLPFCILPNGTFLKIWMGIRGFGALLTALLTPYQLIKAPYTPLLDWILFGADIVAYTDLYLMLFVGYYGPKNQLIMHPLKTAANYIKRGFIFDFTICFPWDILEVYIVQHDSNFYLSHPIFYTIKMIKVLQIYKLIQNLDYWATDITKRGHIYEMLKFFVFTVFITNICATILVFSTCKYYAKENLKDSDYINKTFVQLEDMTPQKVKPYIMFCQKGSWIDQSKYQNVTEVHTVYILSMYFCTSTFTTCGIGDITVKQSATYLMKIAMILCGVFFFGYIYAKISSHKITWGNLFYKKQEMIKQLKNFMIDENVRKNLQNKIIDGFEYRWKRSRGVERNKILANIYPVLHEDAALEMYKSILEEISLFEGADNSFFRAVGTKLKEMYYRRREVICRVDDIVSDIFIINKGKVLITSKEDDAWTLMGRGGIFGNITPQDKTKISVTVTALNKVDILYMKVQTFRSIVQQYESLKQRIDDNLAKGLNFIVTDIVSYNVHREESGESLTPSTLQKPWSSSENLKLSSVRSKLKQNALTCFLPFIPWKWCHIALHPDSFVFNFFDIFFLVMIYVNCLLASFEFAFQYHTTEELCIFIMMDVTFIMKLIIDMHRSFENSYGDVVTDNTKILKRYLKKNKVKLYLDFFVTIPMQYGAFFLSLVSTVDCYMVFSSIRLITLCKFIHLIDFYNEKYNQLLINKLALKICAIYVTFTLTLHFLACGWYLNACPLTHCFDESWVKDYFVDGNKTVFEKYLTCIYFMLQLFITAGTGDVVPHDNSIHEQIYLIFVMMLSNFLIGIFIGEVLNILQSTSIARINYEYRITELKHYLKNGNISEFQMKQLWKYVKGLWTASNGEQMPKLITQLNSAALDELMSEIYGHHLKKSFIFSDVEESFARQLSRFLKRTIFFQGNYIVKSGTSDKSLYFIHYGEVQILTIHPNLTETIHDVLHAGEMFGITQGLYRGVPHHFTFRASSEVHIISLCLDDWEDLLNFFPKSKESLYSKANNVYSQM